MITYLICKRCEKAISIPRGVGLQKEVGHIKLIWCYKCNNTTGHIVEQNEF